MIRHALADAWPWLALIGGGVLLLATFGRDPKADEHDLSDYHAEETAELGPRQHAPTPFPRRFEPLDVQAAVQAIWAAEGIPPAPPGMNAGSPLYAGMLFDTWHPESPSDTADRFLRELRDEALAGAR